MNRRMPALFKADAAAYARRQAILQQLEELLKRRAASDGSRIWKCPGCRRLMRSDHDRLPRRGEAVCTQCDCAMKLQPTMQEPLQMSEYRVKMIIGGRNTYVTVSAYNAAEAAQLARAQYAGNSVRVLETSRVR